MIVDIQPADVENAPSVVAFSSALDNISAVQEIDEWARTHGFIRSREYTLNVKQDVAGNRLYYSACYRLTSDDKRASEADLARMRQRRDAMTLSASSETLLREGG